LDVVGVLRYRPKNKLWPLIEMDQIALCANEGETLTP
jgi:hypothetical protein